MGNIVLIAVFEVLVERKSRQFNVSTKSSDYSILLKGLPKDITMNEIQKFIEDKLLYIGAPETTVVKIYLIYDFKMYQALYERKREWIETIVRLQYEVEQNRKKSITEKDYRARVRMQEKEKSLN